MAPPSGIEAAAAELGIAETLLRSDAAAMVDAARHLLASVEAELGRLASDGETDTETAGLLLSARADLSGHLLAAAALETAGAPTDGVARMLRRAAGIARAGLAAKAAPVIPVGAGRR